MITNSYRGFPIFGEVLVEDVHKGISNEVSKLYLYRVSNKKKKNTDKCVLVGVNFRDFVKCSKFFFSKYRVLFEDSIII